MKSLLNILRRLWPWKKILCDTCKYDWGTACNRPERPNAVVCDDYKRK